MALKDYIKKHWQKPTIRFFIVGTVLWGIYLETQMSFIAYERGVGYSWSLAGWGIIAFPFVVGMAVFPTALCWCFKFIHWKVAWVVLLLLWGVAFWHACHSITPESRFRRIAGDELADVAILDKFRMGDTFGDGHWARGAFHGDPEKIIGILSEKFKRRKGPLPEALKREVGLLNGTIYPDEYWHSRNMQIAEKGGRFFFWWYPPLPATPDE